MLVLLDTNAYLRLAKRIRPAVGISFGQKGYVLTVHKSVEEEVHRNPRLKAKYPWFDSEEFVAERLAKQIRLGEDDKQDIAIVQSILHGSVWTTLTATLQVAARRLGRQIAGSWP